MKIFTGVVTHKRDEKTAKVEVARIAIHPLYKKRFRRTKSYLVQDEVGVSVGDKVKFSDSRPYSKTKKWKIIGGKISEKGKVK